MREGILTNISSFGEEARPVIIGSGFHGTIEFDPASRVVSKLFKTSDATEAAELAQREFDCLGRFSAALVSQPFLRCPAPVSVEPERGIVRMTHCSGFQLDHLLALSSGSMESHLDHLAEQIALAAEVYINEFDEPYYDLATKHVLYEASSRTLHLIDFTSRRRMRHASTRHAPLETSLGIFNGLSLFDTVRLATWTNQGYWKCQERLSTGVLVRLSARHDLRLPLLRQVSAAVYTHGRSKGGRLRRIWLATVGQALFNRRHKAILNGATPRLKGE
jgi:hypothetical protein